MVAASEIQMMALPHAQYVIAEASTPVSGVNSNQVKTVSTDWQIRWKNPNNQIFTNFSCCLMWSTFYFLNKNVLVSFLQTHYVISEGQTEMEAKHTVPQNATQAHAEHLEEQTTGQQTTTQYIITTTTNGGATGEVHITKPWNAERWALQSLRLTLFADLSSLYAQMNSHGHAVRHTDDCKVAMDNVRALY